MQVVVPAPHTEQVVIVDVDAELASKKKAMKRLTCRKCEGHGFHAILKGHAGTCPFKDCSCGTCQSVMSMRANALIRRFRHRQPDKQMAVVKTLRSKNGNMRLRIVARGADEECVVDHNGTLVTYCNDKNGHQTYTTTNTQSVRRSSIMTNASDGRDSVVSTPPTTNNSTPSGSPPLLLPFGDEEALLDPMAVLRQMLLKQFQSNPTSLTPLALTLLVQLVTPPPPPPAVNFEALPLPVLIPSFSNFDQIPV